MRSILLLLLRNFDDEFWIMKIVFITIEEYIRILRSFCIRDRVVIAWKYRSQSVTLYGGSAMRWSKVSGRFRRLATNRILFYRIASEFYKIGNLFVAMEFSATTNFADHPAGARATAKLSFAVVVFFFFFCEFRANECKMRKFRGFLRHVVQKLPAMLCSLLFLPLRNRDILLYYLIISRASRDV